MATAGAAAAAIAQATKASGVIVQMEPAEFQQLVYRIPNPLVVLARGGMVKKKYRYLTSYKGIAFFTASTSQVQIPGGAEVVAAKQIWVP